MTDPQDPLVTIGAIARQRRERMNLRQDELEQLGGPAVSTVRKFEQGREQLAQRTYARIEAALGWRRGTISDFLFANTDQERMWDEDEGELARRLVNDDLPHGHAVKEVDPRYAAEPSEIFRHPSSSGAVQAVTALVAEADAARARVQQLEEAVPRWMIDAIDRGASFIALDRPDWILDPRSMPPDWAAEDPRTVWVDERFPVHIERTNSGVPLSISYGFFEQRPRAVAAGGGATDEEMAEADAKARTLRNSVLHGQEVDLLADDDPETAAVKWEIMKRVLAEIDINDIRHRIVRHHRDEARGTSIAADGEDED